LLLADNSVIDGQSCYW